MRKKHHTGYLHNLGMVIEYKLVHYFLTIDSVFNLNTQFYISDDDLQFRVTFTF